MKVITIFCKVIKTKEIFTPQTFELAGYSRLFVTYITGMGKNNFIDMGKLPFWEQTFVYFEIGLTTLEMVITSENFQKFLATDQHFDVVVIEMCLCDALLGLGKHFNAPIIATSAFGASKWTTDLVGTPNFASYIPHHMSTYSDRMTFWQRMHNTLTIWFEELAFKMYFIPIQQRMLERIFPHATNWPTIDAIRRSVALVLLDTHVTFAPTRPYTPNMIEVGGMHINQEHESLSPKVRKFLDEATNGAIVLSLGSNVLLSKLPEVEREAILNAFSAYPKIRFLIKCDDPVVIPSHAEADVLVEPWLTQKAVLAHPNVRVFITHAGLLSVMGE